jgi:hypothetical protein
MGLLHPQRGLVLKLPRLELIGELLLRLLIQSSNHLVGSMPRDCLLNTEEVSCQQARRLSGQQPIYPSRTLRKAMMTPSRVASVRDSDIANAKLSSCFCTASAAFRMTLAMCSGMC